MATLVPQDLAFADTAPVIIERDRVLRAAPQEVWAVLCDHERWPDWFDALTSVKGTSEPASGVGSTRTVSLPGGISVDERFIAWDEPELWAFTGLTGPPLWTSLVERVALKSVGDGTHVTYRMAIEPRRGCTWLVKLASGGVGRALAKALENLDPEVVRRRPSATDAADQT